MSHRIAMGDRRDDPTHLALRSRFQRVAAPPVDPVSAPAEPVPGDRKAGEAETALVGRAKGGDPRARERLIELYLPRIRALAREYAVSGLEPEDLVQEGCVGLLRALVRFDLDRGVPFWPYATWWVRQALQELRSDFLRPLRLPPKALGQLSRIKSTHGRLYQLSGREPTLEELAAGSGIDRARLEELLRVDSHPRSLDEPVRGVEGELGLVGDLLEDPLSADEYEAVLSALAGSQVAELLGRLTEREREIVAARFGFGVPTEHLVEIGERLGISAERVRQLEERALAKLRRLAV